MNPDSSPRFAVVGHPVAHSQSPFIHHSFGQQTGKSLVYERLLAPLDGFRPVVTRFFNEGGSGLNVTVPFKEQAFKLAARNLSTRARIAGAVNTLWQEAGVLHGCNTDGAGLVADLARLGHAAAGKRVLLLGAGGAARGAAASLLEAHCTHLHIANRTAARARRLHQDLTEQIPGSDNRLSTGNLTDLSNAHAPSDAWDIVINATSASLDTSTTLDLDINYADQALAYDMVYGARETPFMTQAREQGAGQVADGLGMLVGQAAVSFHIWHGVEPSIEPVLQALRQKLK